MGRAIVPVATPRELRAFVELPYALYARNPMWVPPLRRDEYRRLSPRRNAFLQHARMQLWVVIDGSHVTGRIALIEDRRHNDTHHERAAWFGFLEAESPEVIRLLLATVEARARAEGAAILRGPANPSLNESAGLLVDGFDDRPSVLMPYNPPFYAAAIEAAGFTPAKDLLAWDIDPTAPLPARLLRVAARVQRSGRVRIRPVNMARFDEELAVLQDIYRAAWQDNWGFVAPTDAEVRQLARELRPIVDPAVTVFAELDGAPVGCAVAIPDANEVLARMNGRLFPFGFVHFLKRRSIITRLRVVLLGVLPRARHLGLYPVLIAAIHRGAAASGYRRAELSWTLEDNHAVNAGIVAAGGRRYKTYRLYGKRL